VSAATGIARSTICDYPAWKEVVERRKETKNTRRYQPNRERIQLSKELIAATPSKERNPADIVAESERQQAVAGLTAEDKKKVWDWLLAKASEAQRRQLEALSADWKDEAIAQAWENMQEELEQDRRRKIFQRSPRQS
jgi:hypothetical protein